MLVLFPFLEFTKPSPSCLFSCGLFCLELLHALCTLPFLCGHCVSPAEGGALGRAFPKLFPESAEEDSSFFLYAFSFLQLILQDRGA